MDNAANESSGNFLDPNRMQSILIKVSIYIAAYESLKDVIKSRVKEIYLTDVSKDNGGAVNPKYQSEVLYRSRSPLYASLDWLREKDVITQTDLETHKHVKECRNKLAHELMSFLGNKGLPPDFEQCFHEVIELLAKIERWWISNVEIPCNPDFDGKDVDINDIIPGRVTVLRLMCDIALGSEEKSKYYYEEYKKRYEKIENRENRDSHQ